MECDKIYKSVRDRLVQRNSRGVFAWKKETKEANIRIYNNDECRRRRKNKKTDNGNREVTYDLGKQQGSVDEEMVGQISMELRSKLLQHSIRSRSNRQFRPEFFDKFRSTFSSEIRTYEVAWRDCEKNKKFQSRLYGALDEGILLINDIPKIPEEYESSGKMEFFGIDTEDDSVGEPHFFQFATRDQVYISASFRLLLRYIMNKHHLNKSNHIIWGTNIEYELGNIFKDWDISYEFCDVRWTKGGLKKFELNYVPEKLSWANSEDYKGTIKVWDTTTHWKMGVAGMGKVLSSKIKFDFNKLKSDYYGFQYAAMDAIISRSYACVQKRYYDGKNIPLKFTPGSTALTFYMKGHAKNGDKLCKHKLYGTHSDDELDWLMKGFRGGRTEVFSLKEYYGKIGYFDINSAYPYAMKYGTFPHPRRHHWSRGHIIIKREIDAGYEGMVNCKVDASEVTDFVKHIPYLGTIDEATMRYIFPLGKWQGHYTVFEIKKAIALGYKFKFKEAIMYEPSMYQPFTDFVDLCYEIRDEGSRTGDTMLRDIGKSLSNNLYGKFSQKANFTVLENPDNYKVEDIQDCIQMGESILVEKNDGYALHTNVIWGAYITAMTRDNLYGCMLNAAGSGNEVIYCDTDSLFIFGGKSPKTHQTKLGALKLENYFSYFRAYLPKTYAYETVEGYKGYRAKGVPSAQRERFLVTGMVEYKKPMKIRQAMRRKNFGERNKHLNLKKGITSINAWITETKELKGEYTKRIVLPNKETIPHVLGGKING